VRTIASLLLLLAFAGCQSNGDTDSTASATVSAARDAAAPAAEAAGTFTGEVIETMNAGGYTYVQVDTGSETIWAAGPQQSMATGTRVEISKAMPMRGFRSETLEQTFDVLYFVGAFEPEGEHGHAEAGGDPHGGSMMGGQASPTAATDAPIDLGGIAPAGQTVAAVHANKADLAGQTIRVRGKVVKALSGIMGSNWLHIQDGTGEAGSNDLTVTTSEMVEVGSTVVVEGVLSVDRDFGAGYKYTVIIENADVTVE